MATDRMNQSDGELLETFAADGSEAAFAALVERHGSMVHGVCLRVLRDHHDAQDVTQAVFLALAHKARSMQRIRSVGAWLHIVAWRLAVKTRLAQRARQQREQAALAERELMAELTSNSEQYRDELDAAIGELPERYRLPLVLFHLEGQSLQETSDQLGLNPNTTGTRLARARDLLRKKLVRRGVPVASVGALVTLLGAAPSMTNAATALPPTFAAATAKAASLTAAGTATAATVTPAVAELTREALHIAFWAQVKTVALTVVACVAVTGAVAVGTHEYVRLTSQPEPLTFLEEELPGLGGDSHSTTAGQMLPPPLYKPSQPQPVDPSSATARGPSPIVSETVDLLGLEMSVGLAKDVWLADESLALTVHLRNTTDGNFRIRNPHNPAAWTITLGPWTMKFRESNVAIAGQIAGKDVIEIITLEPGDVYDVELVCANAYYQWSIPTAPRVDQVDQLKPGTYPLRVGRVFMSTDFSDQAAQAQGTVTTFLTHPLTIEVVAPAD